MSLERQSPPKPETSTTAEVAHNDDFLSYHRASESESRSVVSNSLGPHGL